MKFIDFFLARTSTFLYGPYKRFVYTGTELTNKEIKIGRLLATIVYVPSLVMLFYMVAKSIYLDIFNMSITYSNILAYIFLSLIFVVFFIALRWSKKEWIRKYI